MNPAIPIHESICNDRWWLLKNHYATLNVSATATAQDIRRAYRLLARKAHPDAGGNPSSFRALQQAYEVLGDPDKRAQYDRDRDKWARDAGAFLCPGCGAANAVSRKPKPGEVVCCARCSGILPVDLPALVTLQKARLISETQRMMDTVGLELVEAATDVIKTGIARVRSRLTRRIKDHAPEK